MFAARRSELAWHRIEAGIKRGGSRPEREREEVGAIVALGLRPLIWQQHRLTRDRHYTRSFCQGAPLKLQRLALLRSLSELKGDRRASLLVGSGTNDDVFLWTSPHPLL